jgi:hypothetical protein
MTARKQSIEASIHRVESRVFRRRDEVGATLAGISRTVRNRMVSPLAIATAGLVGFMLQRRNRLKDWKLLPLLQAASSSAHVLLTLSQSRAPPGE